MIDYHFARVPCPVYDALERGEITSLQFEILALMHRVADWKTGIVASWSAREFLFRQGNPKPSEAEERIVQRAQSSLRMMGWYRDTYKRGSKKPYVVTLHNFVVYGPCLDSDADKITDNDHESYVINECQITSYATNVTDNDPENHQRHDGDVVGDDRRQMSAKDHIRSQPSAAPLPSPAVPGQPSGQNKADGTEAASQLREIIGWVPDNAPKILGRLLQTFTFADIVAEFKDAVDREWGITNTKRIAAKFAKGGAELEAELRRHRKERQVVEGLVVAGVDRKTAQDAISYNGISKVLATLRADTIKKRKGKS